MSYTPQRISGFLCTVLGTVILLLSVGYLLVRVAFALLGLMLINYGLQLQGTRPLHYRAYSWFSRTQWR